MIRFEPVTIHNPVSTPASCTRLLTERMAEDIRELAFAGQNNSPEDLVRLGYPADVVKRLGPNAVALARRQSTRQVAV